MIKIYKNNIKKLLIISILTFALLTQNQDEQGMIDLGTVFNPETAQELAAYSLAASCNPLRIEKWKCGQPCELYPYMTDIKIAQNKDQTVLSFVGYNTKSNKIILTFKPDDASISYEDILKANTELVQYDCQGLQCKVSKVFSEMYQSIQKETNKNLQEIIKQHPDASVYLTGYSAGAALSTLSAADLIYQDFKDFYLYTYGSPRVGNLEFAFWIRENMINKTFRITHSKDPIVHLPLQSQDYHHLPQEIFYPDDSQPGDLHIFCNLSGEDPNCSDQYKLPTQWKIQDHYSYMGFQSQTIYSNCASIKEAKQDIKQINE